jgi:spore maturation protein CgeB
LLGILHSWWPDYVVVVSGFFISDHIWEVMQARHHRVILLCTESPYEDDVQFERMMKSDACVTLINDPINLWRYRKFNKRVWYMPHAFDPEIHQPGPLAPEYECDFGFVGTGYPSRVELFEGVDWSGLTVRLEGNWKGISDDSSIRRFIQDDPEICMPNSEAVRFYNSTKVSANCYRARTGTIESNDPRLSEGEAIGPREVELAASGTFFAREPRAEGDKLFPFLPTFSDSQELQDIVRHYVQHDDAREALAIRAMAAVQDRTFDANARRLMQLLPD